MEDIEILNICLLFTGKIKFNADQIFNLYIHHAKVYRAKKGLISVLWIETDGLITIGNSRI